MNDIKVAVLGGEGVGKSGELRFFCMFLVLAFCYVIICNALLSVNHCFALTALIVRFLTRRFIGEYASSSGTHTSFTAFSSHTPALTNALQNVCKIDPSCLMNISLFCNVAFTIECLMHGISKSYCSLIHNVISLELLL